MSITILIVDDEDNFREGLDQYLTFKKFNVLEAANLTEARKQLRENSIDVVLLDVQIGKEYGPDLLDDIRLVRPTPITILLTAYGEVDMAVAAMKNGAFDFMSKPVNLPELEKRLKEAEKACRYGFGESPLPWQRHTVYVSRRQAKKARKAYIHAVRERMFWKSIFGA